MLHTDLNRLRTGLIKVEGKTALMSLEQCFVLHICKYLKYMKSEEVSVILWHYVINVFNDVWGMSEREYSTAVQFCS